MKSLKVILVFALSSGLLFSGTSCIVVIKEDHGRHWGWYKNPKNPHNHENHGKPENSPPGKGNHPHEKGKNHR
ncbi:MAG: hypothetical protein HY840_11255 [Bacteroidetes bacterium]|nr:hypothetical protein [Bacteroidota bacterium]